MYIFETLSEFNFIEKVRYGFSDFTVILYSLGLQWWYKYCKIFEFRLTVAVMQASTEVVLSFFWHSFFDFCPIFVFINRITYFLYKVTLFHSPIFITELVLENIDLCSYPVRPLLLLSNHEETDGFLVRIPLHITGVPYLNFAESKIKTLLKIPIIFFTLSYFFHLFKKDDLLRKSWISYRGWLKWYINCLSLNFWVHNRECRIQMRVRVQFQLMLFFVLVT